MLKIENSPIETIHITDIPKFLQCRRLWKYSVIENLEPRKKSLNAYWFGTGLHKVLQWFYDNGGIELTKTRDINDIVNWVADNIWEEYVIEYLSDTNIPWEKTTEYTTLLKSMIREYIPFAQKNDVDYTILGTELKFFSTLGGYLDVPLECNVDLLLRHNNRNQHYIVDHKGFAIYTESEYLEFDYQMSGYLYILKENGLNVVGCIYNMLRKKIPAEPILLKKSGELSKDKGIDTTVEKYKRAINKYGLDVNDYQDILAKIATNEFSKRETIIRTNRHLNLWAENCKAIMQDMFMCVENPNMCYPTPSNDSMKGCIKCQFKQLCRCESDGGDVNIIKDTDFKVKEERR